MACSNCVLQAPPVAVPTFGDVNDGTSDGG